MTAETLTAVLAKRVMGWGVGPDRFTTSSRHWLPRWRFQPTRSLEDAFRLLEQVAPREYAMGASEDGAFWATVRLAGTTGEARESSQPRALTFAIARAVGIQVDASE